MKKYFTKKYPYVVGACLLTGCAFQDQGIENKTLRDKVIACGAGFSDIALGTLGATDEKFPFNLQANAGLKSSAEEIIFTELPPQDRLKAYKDYIACIKSTTFSRGEENTR